MRVVGFRRIGKLNMRPGVNCGTGSARVTVQYTVDGLLPDEGRAWLCLNGPSWTILRENDGVYTDGLRDTKARRQH